jgi:hypothetical protein
MSASSSTISIFATLRSNMHPGAYYCVEMTVLLQGKTGASIGTQAYSQARRLPILAAWSSKQ